MSSSEHEIWLEPGNPFDFDRDEVELLGESIGNELPEEQLTVQTLFREEEGYGVSASEVILVWLSLDVAREVVVRRVTEIAVDWAKERWRQRRERDAPERDLIVDILAPNGDVLSSVRVNGKTGEPKDETGGKEPLRRRRHPRERI